MVQHGVRVVVVPGGAEQFQWLFLQELSKGGSFELMRVLVPMKDAHANFQLPRLSAVSSCTHASHIHSLYHTPSYRELRRVSRVSVIVYYGW